MNAVKYFKRLPGRVLISVIKKKKNHVIKKKNKMGKIKNKNHSGKLRRPINGERPFNLPAIIYLQIQNSQLTPDFEP